MAKVLVEVGDGVDALDLDGMNTLHCAACNVNVEMPQHWKTSRS
jgi:hypothetical protein